jgi:hypothetical protein
MRCFCWVDTLLSGFSSSYFLSVDVDMGTLLL